MIVSVTVPAPVAPPATVKYNVIVVPDKIIADVLDTEVANAYA